MDFQRYQLGSLDRGAIVSVTLSTGANVRLMNSSDLGRYQRGEAHSYYGGLANRSPFDIVVPHAGSWYLTVDLAGLAASSVSIGVSVSKPDNARRYMDPPTRPDGYYSEQRKDETVSYFVGKNGKITAERPHVHVIHSRVEGRITVIGTNRDGTHFGEQTLPYDSPSFEVETIVRKLRKKLR